MAEEGYNNYSHNNDDRHLRRDVHEAHTDAKLAKMLATLALLTSAIALGLSLWAMDKAGEAQSQANRANENVQQVR